jgi:hypothetical protein
MRKSSSSKSHDEHTKLKELILYIANRLADDPKFGATKLNKILFYSDFIAYAKLGKSITGEKYQKLPKGPAPKYLVPVREQMRLRGDIVCYSIDTLVGPQHRIAPLRSANIKKFTSEQISIIDEVMNVLRNKDADEVSELSHDFIGWKIVKDGEEIPYETVFLRDPKDIEITQKDREIALKLAKKHGL